MRTLLISIMALLVVSCGDIRKPDIYRLRQPNGEIRVDTMMHGYQTGDAVKVCDDGNEVVVGVVRCYH